MNTWKSLKRNFSYRCEINLPIVRKIIAKDFFSSDVLPILINKMIENSQIESSFTNKIKLIGRASTRPIDYSRMIAHQGDYYG